MGTKRKVQLHQYKEVCDYYLSGKSLSETGLHYGMCHVSIIKILRHEGVERRSLSEANTLSWKNPEVKKKFVKKRTGQPSNAKGKTWKLNHVKKSPNLLGDKNHFWNGGKTSLYRQIRSSNEYKQWRFDIFKRDNFSCQHCDSRNINGKTCVLHADHIYPFAMILKDFKIEDYDQAINCEKLWDRSNGRTLCIDCHKKTDSYLVRIKKLPSPPQS